MTSIFLFQRNKYFHSVKRFNLILLTLLCSFSPLIGQVMWINGVGTGDGRWDTAANWDTNAVPTNADDVIINGIFGPITINTGVNAEAKSIQVDGGGVLTIEIGAELQISNSTAAGIFLGNISAGTIINNGIINSNVNIGDNPLLISQSSTFVNNGLVNLDNSLGGFSAGMMFLNFNGTFTNNVTGHINIGPNINNDGIQFFNFVSAFNNDGTINILGAGQNGLGLILGSATVFNTGTLCINDPTVVGANIAPGITFNNTGTYNTSGCIATSPFAPVPTLGEWGLIFLTLLVIIIGLLYAGATSLATSNGHSIQSPISLKNLPFNKAIYLQSLILVTLSVMAIFSAAIIAFGYELTSADPFGVLFTVPMVAYVVFLLRR